MSAEIERNMDAAASGLTPRALELRLNRGDSIDQIAREFGLIPGTVDAMRERWSSGSSSIDNAIAAAREAKLAKRAERNA